MFQRYLPDMGAGEMVIARIAIRSTTGDVTSLHARRNSKRIVYRMVDESEEASAAGSSPAL